MTKFHLSRLDSETSYCGKSTNTIIYGKKIDARFLVADIEKVTCMRCNKLHDKELGITSYLWNPEQSLSYWAKIICESNSYNLLGSKISPDKDKPGCIVSGTANPLVRIFRLGIQDMIIVPLFI